MEREEAIRVYLLDSDLQQLNILQRCVQQKEDFCCVGAGIDGRTLLYRLKDGLEIDLLICDMMLRDMDAVELLERLDELALPQLPRILVMLGRANSAVQDHLLSLGADLCLSRPCSMDTMFRRAKMLCGAGGLGLKVRIRRMLRQLGLIPNDSGYRYLIEALEIMVATEEPRAIVKDVYAEVARKENVTPVGVESSIRRMLWKIKEQNSELYQEMEALCKGEMSNARLLRLLADRQRSEIEQLEEEGC